MSMKGKKGTPGAPVKLTREVIDKICTYLKMGAYVETAAQAAGINKSTLYDWLKRGARQKRGLHKALSDELALAIAEGELRDVLVLDNHANGRNGLKADWRAAAWRLERRNSKKWGMRQSIEHTGVDGGPIQTATLTDEQIQEELKRLREANEACDDTE